MAVQAALIPQSQLVPLQPAAAALSVCSSSSSSSSSSSTASSSSSPSPCLAAPAAASVAPPATSSAGLFRPESLLPVASSAPTPGSGSTGSGITTTGGGSSPNLLPGSGGISGGACTPGLAAAISTTSTAGGSAAPPGKPVYSTPSPVENTPQNNECRMVELRGAKVASFTVEGCELICLPQAFDLFLKHLVGGLHTVYTKLKRLEITPVVCNVEQVRILRGLGAIQPGVNRCKLISRRDFETLYNDCTNASSRPGRPPKRTQSVTSPENSHIMPHTVPGLMSPGMIPPTGLTAAAAAAAAATNAAIAEAMKVKKIKLEAMTNYHGSNNQHGTDSDNGDLNSSVGSSDGSWDKERLQSPPAQGSQASLNHANMSGQHNLAVSHPLNPLQQNRLLSNGLELPFMMMSHPLIPVSLPPASVTMAMSQMNHLSTIANMAAAAQVQSPPSRVETSVIKERVPDSPSPAPSLEEGRRPGSHPSSHRSSSVSSSPARTESSSDRIPTLPHCFSWDSLQFYHGTLLKPAVHQNGLSMNQMLMSLSPNVLPGPKEGDLAGHDVGHETKRMHIEKEGRQEQRRGQRCTENRREIWQLTAGGGRRSGINKLLAGQEEQAAKGKEDETPLSTPTARDCFDKLSISGHGQQLPPGFPSPFLFPDGLSSIETLLTNIQGLLKVAIDNARAQEKQVQMEKTELKMELFRERELRETLEKQLAVEQKNRAIIQKRLKKEKKAKRKLQEALEFETKRREQAEQALNQAASPDGLRVLNDSMTPEMEADRSGGRTDAERTIQDGRLYLKTAVMY